MSKLSSLLARADGRFRFAVLDGTADVEAIVFVARRLHEESRFSYISFAPDKVRAIAKRAFTDPKRHGVMMCWKDDAPVGLLHCSIGEYHIGAGALVTTIHTLGVLNEVRTSLRGGRAALGLLKGAETWSQARKSTEIMIHVTSGVDLARAHKFIKRSGYSFIGGSYAKRLI